MKGEMGWINLKNSMMTRDLWLDITRIIAFCLVVSVHFFLNTGFYITEVMGLNMYIMVAIRTVCMTCVPLFLLLTGYLMSSKKIDMSLRGIISYYKGVNKVLLTYCVSTVFIILYRRFCLNENEIDLKNGVLNLLGFQQYSWYIEMYLGLYLLIPFLNNCWHNIFEKKTKIAIVVILLTMTCLPSITNCYDFVTKNALLKPSISDSFTPIIPQWWVNIYPITYYVIGAFIKEYIDIKKLKSHMILLVFCLSVLLASIYNIWRSMGIFFVWGSWCDWGGVQNVCNSVLLFLLINSFKTQKSIGPVKYISDLTLGGYLLSWISDYVVYSEVNVKFQTFYEKERLFLQLIAKSIIIALALSMAVSLTIYLLTKTINVLKNRCDLNL